MVKVRVRKAFEKVAEYYRPIEYTRYSITKGVIKVKTIKRKPRKWNKKIVEYRQCIKEKMKNRRFIQTHGSQRAFQLASKLCVLELKQKISEKEKGLTSMTVKPPSSTEKTAQQTPRPTPRTSQKPSQALPRLTRP